MTSYLEYGNLIVTHPKRVKPTHGEIKVLGLSHAKTDKCGLYCAWLRFWK